MNKFSTMRRCLSIFKAVYFRLSLLACVVIVLDSAWSADERADNQARKGPTLNASDAMPSSGATTANPQDAAAGMVLHIDPETGEITAPFPSAAPLALPDTASEPLAEAFSTSAKGLSQILSATPGGGVMIDLQGRFLSPLEVRLEADGRLTVQHGHAPPAPEQAKE